MKSLDLKLQNVQVMNDDELRQIDGGLIGAIIAVGLAIAYLASTVYAVSQGKNPHTGGNLP